MKNVWAFVFLLGFLGQIYSCSSETPIKKKNDTLTQTQVAVESKKRSASIPDTSFKGLYITGDEVNIFRDCSNGRTYWVDDPKHLLKQAYLKAKDQFSYPYESFYCEVQGYLKGKSEIGYASEYDNVLVTNRLKSFSQKSFSTECYDYEFIALGNEPFWLAEIIPAEKIISFKDIAAQKTYVFPYRPSKKSESFVSYESKTDRGETIKISFKKEQCGDGMSDRKYHYSAQVTLNGKSFSGCGIKKGDKVD